MQGDTYTHTSLFLKGLIEQSRNVSLNSKDNKAAIILKNMERKEYDIVRESNIFKKLSKELSSYIQIKS